jgi:hypothetical protein
MIEDVKGRADDEIHKVGRWAWCSRIFAEEG